MNKGDGIDVKIRSRVVGQEFNVGVAEDDWFAGTPPLEALRMLMSQVATLEEGEIEKDKVVV